MPIHLHKLKPSSFFIWMALVCEILFLWTTPPLQSPDEFNHFYRTYQIAEGYFLPHQADKRLGGEIPYDLSDFVAPFQLASRVREYRPDRNGRPDSFEQEVSDATTFRDFPNTSYYSPVSYLPQALAVFLLKQCNASAAALYYGGRIFGFVVCMLVMWYAIRLMPVYRWLFTMLAMLPMNLFIFNSFSADNVTNILSFLFMALVFRITFNESGVGYRQIVLLLGLACLLALAKIVYIALVLLVLIIPVTKFHSRKQQLFCVAAVFLCSFLIATGWSSTVMKNYLAYKDYNPEYRDGATLVPEANYSEQKAYILDHPGYFPSVIVKSILNPDQTYLQGYIGHFGAYQDVQMPEWLVVVSYLVILFIALAEKSPYRFSLFQRMILFFSVTLCFSLLLLSQHLTWDPVGSGRVDLIQGRYLTPLFPLFFMLPGNWLNRFAGYVPAVAIVFVVIINAAATWLLYQRYVYSPYNETLQFTCDVEKMDNAGNFGTSSYAYLQGCTNQNSDEKRSGKFSAFISPRCPYCFTYVFRGLKKGDLVDISFWKKGEAALCFAGGEAGGKPYYNEFNNVWYTDRNGWENLHGILEITQASDTVNIGFFAACKDNKTGYVDDLTFTIKKKR